MTKKPKGSPGEPPVDEARAGRMFDALTGLELRERRRLTLEELGARIAAEEGRAMPYSGSVVRRWLKGLSEPGSLALWRAIGAVLGVPPSWLAFGEEPIVAPPTDGADTAAPEGTPRPARVYGRQAPVSSYVRGTTLERRAAAEADEEARRGKRKGG